MTSRGFDKDIKQGLRGYSRTSQPGADHVRKVLYRDKFADLLTGDFEVAVQYRRPPEGDADKPSGWFKHYLKRQELGRERAFRLLTTQGFTKDVLKLARRWGLGIYLCEVDHFEFSFDSVSGLLAWRTVLQQLSQKHSAEHWEDFRSHLRSLAKQFSEDLTPGRVTDGVREWFSQMPHYAFDRELRDLMGNYGLGPLWQRSIEVLLLTGKLYVPERYSRLVVMRTDDGDRVLIELFGETRLDDVRDVWRHTEPFRESVLPDQATRQRPSHQVDRDLETEARLAEGMTIPQIAASTDEWLKPDAEMRRGEALRKGRARQAKRREDEASAATDPEVQDWLWRMASEVMEGGKELHF